MIEINVQFPDEISQEMKDLILKKTKESCKRNPPKDKDEAYKRLIAIAQKEGFEIIWHKEEK